MVEGLHGFGMVRDGGVRVKRRVNRARRKCCWAIIGASAHFEDTFFGVGLDICASDGTFTQYIPCI